MVNGQSRVEEMLEKRTAQIAQERAEKRVGRAMAEDLARVTAAIRRLAAEKPPRKATRSY